MNDKQKTIASAPTLKRLEKLISAFFFQPNTLILHENGTVETGKGVVTQKWKKKGKRYYFLSGE